MSALSARTVLIVEDEWLVRMELSGAFEDEGFAIVESGSAEEALARLEGRSVAGPRIDLLITDVRLSGPLSGWDLAAQARVIDPGIAVIYVSANPPVPDIEVAGSLFFDKPALVDQVVAAAKRLLN